MSIARRDSRKPLRRASLVTVAACLWALSTLASAQDALLDKARAELAAGSAAAAYATLAPAEAERAGEPAYDYLLGIAALDAGKLTNAVFALERVVSVEPDNMLARAELARAYARLREFQAAQKELDTVRGGRVPDEARAQVERYLGAVETAISQARTQVRGYLSLGGGYDTNVNSATSDSAVAIPSLGGIVVNLASNAVGSGDQFLNVRGGAVVRHTISPDLFINAGFNVDAKNNKDLNAFDTNTFSGFAGVDYLRNDNTWTVALQGEHFRLNSSAFRNALGVLGQVRRPVGKTGGVTAYVQATTLDYLSQRVRDANRYTVGGAYSRALEGSYSPVAYVGAYGGIEDVRASGVAHLGHKFVGVRAGLGMAPTREIDLSVTGSIEYRNYGGTDPLFSVGREDVRYSMRLAADYKLDSFWTVTPAIELTHNDSNVAINDYKRGLFGLTIRRDFR